jgi:type II secretory pathway pseudopilin PulG
MGRSASIPHPRSASRARRGRAPGPRRERGIALLLVLLVIVLGASYAGMRGLHAAYAKPEREARTMQALQQAKQALLGYAANRVRLLGVTQSTGRDVPGALPCPGATLPTNDAQYGRARLTCNASMVSPTILIGRLPWRTLEIPEFTDGAGEGFWYAVSQTFRYNQTGMTPINAHTQGRIRLKADGVVQQSRIVAVIMAPGPALAGQVRGTTSERPDAVNYLERYEVSPLPGVDFDFHSGRPTDDPPPFNDMMVTITEAELFDAIENAIAQRLDESIMPLVAAHRAFWGSLPLATGWFDPSQPASTMNGMRDEYWGHLPVGQQNIQFNGGPSTSGSASVSCSGWDVAFNTSDPYPARTLRCIVSGVAGQNFLIIAPLDSIGRGIFAAPTVAVTPSSSSSVVVTGQIPDNDDDGQIRVQGVLAVGSSTIYIDVPQQQLVATASPTPGPTEWFLYSEWAKFVYYGRCMTSSSTCMTVNELSGTNSSARAAMVLAGRPIQKTSTSMVQNQNPAASVGVAEYLESPHTLGTASFQRRLRTPNVNDRVVALP